MDTNDLNNSNENAVYFWMIYDGPNNIKLIEQVFFL